MVKSLIDKLGRGLRKTIFLGITGLMLTGCPVPDPVPEKPQNKNQPPQTELYVNPTSGVKPLNVYLKLDGNDPNGKEDIKEYKLSIDIGNNGSIEETIVQSTPIDISRTFNNEGSVKIEGQCTDSGSLTDKKSIIVNVSSIPDYVDISGTLEDNENDSGKAGIIRVYNASNNAFLEEHSVNSSGNFSFTLDELVSQLPNGVKLQARTGSTGNYTSYVRTIKLSQGDHSNVIVRAVLYDNPNNSYDNGLLNTEQKRTDFKTHMGRVNFWSDGEKISAGITGFVNGNPYHGLKKWNFGDISDTEAHPTFKGIQVSSTDFIGTDYNQIKDAILNSGYLKASEIPIVYGTDHLGQAGWGSIVRGVQGPGTVVWDDYGNDGYIEGFITYIYPGAGIYQSVINHEVAHGLLFPGHASGPSTPALFDSIMKYTSPIPDSFTPADIKGNYIIDEDTYKGMEPEDDILGMNWL
jgi:hypothetical protein